MSDRVAIIGVGIDGIRAELVNRGTNHRVAAGANVQLLYSVLQHLLFVGEWLVITGAH